MPRSTAGTGLQIRFRCGLTSWRLRLPRRLPGEGGGSAGEQLLGVGDFQVRRETP
jgi:hypothetical protein